MGRGKVGAVSTKCARRSPCAQRACLPLAAGRRARRPCCRRDATFKAREAALQREKEPLAFSLNRPLIALTMWKPSILPNVLCRIEVWFFTGMHTALFVLKELDLWHINGHHDYTDMGYFTLSFGSIGISSGLMSLLLVFFNSQCYARYSALYGACTGMAGAMQEIAQLTSAVLGEGYAAERWDVCRYMLASVMTIYLKVVDLAANRAPSLDPEDWARMDQSEEEWLGRSSDGVGARMPALLRAEEVALLKRCAGKETQVLQMWALGTLRRVYTRAGCSEQSYTAAEDTVLRLRRSCAAVPNMLDQPVPFPYYHALVLLMMVNYAMYAVSFLQLNSYLTPVAMFMIVVTSTGVRELSSALANPFGDDEVDFNSSKFIHKLRGLVSFMCLADWRLPQLKDDPLPPPQSQGGPPPQYQGHPPQDPPQYQLPYPPQPPPPQQYTLTPVYQDAPPSYAAPMPARGRLGVARQLQLQPAAHRLPPMVPPPESSMPPPFTGHPQHRPAAYHPQMQYDDGVSVSVPSPAQPIRPAPHAFPQ